MKIALGLFHFNPHWNLDGRSAHRHCTEALLPFLRAVEQHPSWRISVEISGSGLEFIATAYPGMFRLLRSLLESGRIELISSTYTPTAWIAFPRKDLIKSIELNQQCLARLGLPWTRLFFAQEAFFGEAVTTLSDYFDAAICRDDYLAHYFHLSFDNPAFTRSGFPVIVASNHLLNVFRGTVREDPEFARRNRLTFEHLWHLRRGSTLNDPTSFPMASGTSGDLEWLWYHCGDGNHFGCVHKPDDLNRCYYDPVWSSACIRLLEGFEERGFSLGTVGDWMAAIDYSRSTLLPPLVEGAWNPKLSDGVFCWMGRNATPAENDLALLTAISRARSRVIGAEQAASEVVGRAHPKLEQAWTALLHAQISDGLGWCAGPQAVQQSLRACDQAMLLANQVLDELPPRLALDPLVAIGSDAALSGLTEPPVWPEPELFGVEGSGGYTDLSAPSVRLYECRVTFSDPRCGIRFPIAAAELAYSPSGMETEVIRIPWSAFRAGRISLPLTNGLLEIADGLFLIKDVRSAHVCAIVDWERQTVEFGIDGARCGDEATWRFFLARAPREQALQFANTINDAIDVKGSPSAKQREALV